MHSRNTGNCYLHRNVGEVSYHGYRAQEATQRWCEFRIESVKFRLKPLRQALGVHVVKLDVAARAGCDRADVQSVQCRVSRRVLRNTTISPRAPTPIRL